MIPEQAIGAAANAISESSGMRFDGFWSRVEDLEPEDREYALAEARSALEAAAPFIRAQALEDAAAQVEDECSASDAACFCDSADWLRARAVTERGEE